jgi:NDP-sugar pyrophosphorylase family protein
MLPVAILSGGLATRLRPITETIPKAMVEVAGKPFVYHQLEDLARQGIRSVVLCVGYLGEMIEAAIGNGARFGLTVEYSYDGDTLLGTGGAIKKALPSLGAEFFILYGDSFLPINLSAVHDAYKEKQKIALMTVFKNDGQWDTSNVEFENGRLIEYNKRLLNTRMKYIDYGLSILNAAALDEPEWTGKFDLADLFYSLSKRSSLAGLEVFERFYEIGSHTGLAEAQQYFLNQEHR